MITDSEFHRVVHYVKQESTKKPSDFSCNAPKSSLCHERAYPDILL